MRFSILKNQQEELKERNWLARTRLANFYFSIRAKVNKIANKWALEHLEINEAELSKLIVDREDSRTRIAKAMEVIGMTATDLTYFHKLKAISNASEDGPDKIKDILALFTDSSIDKARLMRFCQMSDKELIDYLLPDGQDHGMQIEFAKVNTDWRTLRDKGPSWKCSVTDNLYKIKTIVEKALIDKQFSYKIFSELTILVYLTFKAFIVEEKTKK